MTNSQSSKNILYFATKGNDSNDGERIRSLLQALPVEAIPFEYKNKAASFLNIVGSIRKSKPALVVMEGTGLAGGLALILCRFIYGARYVFSSGDAVAPFLARRFLPLYPFLWLYESTLFRLCSGFIAWTPYFVGRAVTMGAKHAMTAPGWVDSLSDSQRAASRSEIRKKYNIPEDNIVFGIVGSLDWNPKARYTYGMELIQALRQTKTDNAMVMIVGDGSGLSHLRRAMGAELESRVILTGKVSHKEALEHISAFDVASLPQSCDAVGAMRFSYKLAEYLAAEKPIALGQLPMAYDYVLSSSWRLSGKSPWSEEYTRNLAKLMDTLDKTTVLEKSKNASGLSLFNREEQINRTKAFIEEILENGAAK